MEISSDNYQAHLSMWRAYEPAVALRREAFFPAASEHTVHLLINRFRPGVR